MWRRWPGGGMIPYTCHHFEGDMDNIPPPPFTTFLTHVTHRCSRTQVPSHLIEKQNVELMLRSNTRWDEFTAQD